MTLSFDTTISADGTLDATNTSTGSATTASFSTAANIRLVALCASNSTNVSGGTTHTVSGAGLSWTKEVAANEGAANSRGVATIWHAYSAAALSGVTVSLASGGSGVNGRSITLVGLLGAEVTHAGAENTASSVASLPTVSLTTTRNGSYVFAASSDWDQSGDYAIDATQSPAGTLLQTFNPAGEVSCGQWRTTNTVAASTAVTMACNINTRAHGTVGIEIREDVVAFGGVYGRLMPITSGMQGR